ncbi:MAG TPA: DNA mismatch repair endonuclease MutL [Thermoanaerobaculia bacterium]|nr:DNA mismatch repair endonuclease MutL [Thermoanaerobaculia bacterium]
MPSIHLLPDLLISQIAAGEVVERPASVVKELVENALDAGAREVAVELEAGGKRRIAVIDDGCGMGRDDALLAFDRHATSKIRDFADLQRVATLGFRGEALASIAAVARVEMTTAEQPGAGWRVRIEGGQIRGVEPASRARGTTLEVAALFFNVPARRQFLTATQTELRRCVEGVQGYCLARTDVGFSLAHEGRVLVDAPAVGGGAEGLRQRLRQLFGRGLSEGLVELPAGGGPGERIGGFVGRPDTRRGRRLFVFVNGRLLRDRALLAAFYQAVRDEWRSDELPSLVLVLEIPPERLDVNVHPQKAEVRFRDAGVVERVRSVLREGLRRAQGEGVARLGDGAGVAAVPLAWQGLGGRDTRAAAVGEERGSFDAEQPDRPGAPPAPPRIAELVPRPVTSSSPLSGGDAARRSLRLLGQYKGSLLLLEGPDGMVLVDQHAAHERILYEALEDSLSRSQPAVQRLLQPRLLELAPAEAMRLTELAGGLAPLGFHLEPLSGSDLALVAVPAVLSDDQAVGLLLELATANEEVADAAGGLRQRVLESVAAQRACKAAIKIHHPLREEQMEELVARLFVCRQPYLCPHGRPTLLKLADADLERRFGRRG